MSPTLSEGCYGENKLTRLCKELQVLPLTPSRVLSVHGSSRCEVEGEFSGEEQCNSCMSVCGSALKRGLHQAHRPPAAGP